MNMKKTIAAVAAGAMAVSAMATSLTAFAAERPINYNLVRTVKYTPDSNKFQLYTVLDKSGVASAGYIRFIGAGSEYTVNSMTLTLDAQNAKTKTFTFSPKKSDAEYDPNFDIDSEGVVVGFDLTSFITREVTDFDNTSITITIDVTDATTGQKYSKYEVINDGINKANDDDEPTPDLMIWVIDEADDDAVYDDYTDDDTFDPEDTLSGQTRAKGLQARQEKAYQAPFMTNSYGNENIAYYLQNNKVRTDSAPYTNVLPVINDAIATSESVKFTFTTATKNIKWVVTPDYSKQYDSWNKALVEAKGDESKVVAIYVDEGGDDTYKMFTQHLYNGTGVYDGNEHFYGVGHTGWEGFGADNYLGYDWWDGNNLFGGALVVNENITMSLNDVNYFDYTATTLSFDWDAVQDGAVTSNAYALYVQSIKLATSVRWYWDNLTITVVQGEADDASSSAGAQGNEEEAGEEGGEGTEEIPGGSEGTEEVPAGGQEEQTPPPAPNPQTGNAPVALAVIPVALAAAAIVAKKRS